MLGWTLTIDNAYHYRWVSQCGNRIDTYFEQGTYYNGIPLPHYGEDITEILSLNEKAIRKMFVDDCMAHDRDPV